MCPLQKALQRRRHGWFSMGSLGITRERRCVAEEDPIRARSPIIFVLLCAYMRRYFLRDFRALRVSGDVPAPSGKPLILFTNHPSWWDPVVMMLISSLLFPGRKSYAPMDEAALGKYRIFRRIGVFGIAPGARGAARFLRTSTRILEDPDALLWVTAEGAFTDARMRPVQLRAGVAHVARRVPDAVVLPLAIEYTFWNERRPEALVRFGRPVVRPDDNSVAGWSAALESELEQTMTALADDGMARDPARFRTVVRGADGIGGIYDLWRRLRAMVTRQPFDPSHDGSGRSALPTTR